MKLRKKEMETTLVNVQELKYKTISEIIKELNVEYSVPVDLKNLGCKLQVSIVPLDFDDHRLDGEKIICAFVTNEKGHSCIFYNVELSEDYEFVAGRHGIIQAFVKYIITGDNNFFITQSTYFSQREKMLTYEMLMPKSQVEDVLYQLIMPTTYSLAKIFGVSQSFVKHRLDQMYIRRKIGNYNY